MAQQRQFGGCAASAQGRAGDGAAVEPGEGLRHQGNPVSCGDVGEKGLHFVRE